MPKGLTLIASGSPIGGSRPEGKEGTGTQVWKEDLPSSPYLFGFAVGRFRRTTRKHQGVTLEYFAAGLSDARLRVLFADDDRMLDFFVAKAGRRLPRSFYRQVVVEGDAAQEMTSFSILGRHLLEARLTDPTEDWLWPTRWRTSSGGT